MKLTLEHLDRLQQLRTKLELQPAYATASSETVSFYDDHDREIAFLDTGTAIGWVQRKTGGSETIRL
jgi:hypothetical protein